MIPLTLYLKNFISYGAAQEINFEPYNLICLSGQNGHGKSALLDALTWVLWGQARKTGATAKADEGLMRLGQDHMAVSLDFTCNNQKYRVRREFTNVGQKNHTNLEFGIFDRDTGNLRALTDKTIRATQAKIESMIGLDYESFINSAFLKQGQSNEFSKKSAKERKEILASILGLDHFEQLRRLALDTVKQAQLERDNCKTKIERLEQDLQQKKPLTERFTVLNEQLVEITKKETYLTGHLTDLQAKNKLLQERKLQAEKVEFQKQQLAKTLDERKKEIAQQSQLWRNVHRIQHKQTTYEQLEKERTGLQNELQALAIHAARKIQLKEELLIKKDALKNYIQQIQDTFKKTHEQIQMTLHTTDVTIKAAHDALKATQAQKTALATENKALEKNYGNFLNQLSTIGTHFKNSDISKTILTEELIISYEKKLERRKSYYHTFAKQFNSLNNQITTIQQKKAIANTTDTAICPLCEQTTDKEKLCHKLDREIHHASHQAQRLKKVLEHLKPALIAENDKLSEIKKKAELEKAIRIHLEQTHKQQEQISEKIKLIEREIAGHELKLKHLQSQKEATQLQFKAALVDNEKARNDEHVQKATYGLATLEKNLEQMPFIPQREQSIHLRLTEINNTLNQQSSALKDIALQEERKKSIHALITHARDLQKQHAFLAINNELQTLQQEELHLQEQLKAQLTQAQSLQKEKEVLLSEKGSLEAQLAALDIKNKELTIENTALKKFQQTIDDYTIIATAVSKDGIQALLIEDAIPEIEQEANYLLGRLTENQAHLSIESLRDLRSGKTKETLDIKISDAIGVRPYEMFSGGEAFRIDFALRIAISKLLARRAGTSLQTLIIDEGFGSQDEEGLNHIMEVLHTIQEDFSKIIIVSHLSNMKEQFPVHFLINKTPQGSTVNVIEHC